MAYVTCVKVVLGLLITMNAVKKRFLGSAHRFWPDKLKIHHRGHGMARDANNLFTILV